MKTKKVTIRKIICTIFIITFLFYSLTFANNIQVVFSPDQKPAQHLIRLFNTCESKIHAAVYMFTENNIAQALIRAKNRNIDVQIITDQSCLESSYHKIDLLKKHHIDVFIYSPTIKNKYKKKYPHSLMHHKFAIIDDKKVCTGSFNWTKTANNKNQENIVIINDKSVSHRYEQQFQRLKKRCCVQHKQLAKQQPKKASHPKKTANGIKNNLLYLFKRIRSMWKSN
jgi:phosphatidylserine/phosphatidylglycerophosphate/cardiolipin synthase-like enzyme